MGRAVVHSEAVLLVTPAAVASGLAAELERFKFLLEVTAEDQGSGWSLASVRGPAPAEVPGARAEPMTAVPHGPGLVVRDRSGGVDLLGPRPWVEERLEGLGLPEASAEDWDAWRITAGEQAWGREVVPGRRAQELGLLPTHVHLRKGCYPGQESIAKTYNLGRPRRVLAIVELDGPVAEDAPVEAGPGRGALTSAAVVEGRTLALALLPVDRATGAIAGESVVRAGAATGRVLRLVGDGLPQPGAAAVGAR
jgi:tRNA-modifying protein YgfZ